MFYFEIKMDAGIKLLTKKQINIFAIDVTKIQKIIG